jgi:methylisocitrate lyase
MIMVIITGAKALYLSGSGVATASYGIPDLGVTNLNDVIEDVRRITRLLLLHHITTSHTHSSHQ